MCFSVLEIQSSSKWSQMTWKSSLQLHSGHAYIWLDLIMQSLAKLNHDGRHSRSVYFSFFSSLPRFKYPCTLFISLHFCLCLFGSLFYWLVPIELERPMPWLSWWCVMIDGSWRNWRRGMFIPSTALIPCVRSQTSVFNYRLAEFSLGFA